MKLNEWDEIMLAQFVMNSKSLFQNVPSGVLPSQKHRLKDHSLDNCKEMTYYSNAKKLLTTWIFLIIFSTERRRL